MRNRFALALMLAAAVALPGCARLGLLRGGSATVPATAAGADTPRPMARPDAVRGAALARPPAFGGAAARPAAALDTTTAAERAAAVAAPDAGAVLGTVPVSLGNPAEGGFWLTTALVSAPRPGSVRLPSGRSVAVELRPGAAAAQLSLAAYRALDLGLTDLPVVTVIGR